MGTDLISSEAKPKISSASADFILDASKDFILPAGGQVPTGAPNRDSYFDKIAVLIVFCLKIFKTR